MHAWTSQSIIALLATCVSLRGANLSDYTIAVNSVVTDPTAADNITRVCDVSRDVKRCQKKNKMKIYRYIWCLVSLDTCRQWWCLVMALALAFEAKIMLLQNCRVHFQYDVLSSSIILVMIFFSFSFSCSYSFLLYFLSFNYAVVLLICYILVIVIVLVN